MNKLSPKVLPDTNTPVKYEVLTSCKFQAMALRRKDKH